MEKIIVKREKNPEYDPKYEIESAAMALRSIGYLFQGCEATDIFIQPDFEFTPLASIIEEQACRAYHANHDAGRSSVIDQCAHELKALADVLYWTNFDRIVEIDAGRVHVENFSIKPIGKLIVDYAERIFSQTNWETPKNDTLGMDPEEMRRALVDKKQPEAKIKAVEA